MATQLGKKRVPERKVLHRERTREIHKDFKKKKLHGKTGSKIMMNMVIVFKITDFISDRIKASTAGFLVFNLFRDKQ